jgi:hypothetical protein
MKSRILSYFIVLICLISIVTLGFGSFASALIKPQSIPDQWVTASDYSNSKGSYDDGELSDTHYVNGETLDWSPNSNGVAEIKFEFGNYHFKEAKVHLTEGVGLWGQYIKVVYTDGSDTSGSFWLGTTYYLDLNHHKVVDYVLVGCSGFIDLRDIMAVDMLRLLWTDY